MNPSLFGDQHERRALDQCVVEAYSSVGRTLDDLPYTVEFERLVACVREVESEADPR